MAVASETGTQAFQIVSMAVATRQIEATTRQSAGPRVAFCHYTENQTL